MHIPEGAYPDAGPELSDSSSHGSNFIAFGPAHEFSEEEEEEEVNEADEATTESSSPAMSEKGSTIATVSPSKKRPLEADLERSPVKFRLGPVPDGGHISRDRPWHPNDEMPPPPPPGPTV